MSLPSSRPLRPVPQQTCSYDLFFSGHRLKWTKKFNSIRSECVKIWARKTVTAGFNTTAWQMTEMFQWPTFLSKKWPKCFSDQKFSAKNDRNVSVTKISQQKMDRNVSVTNFSAKNDRKLPQRKKKRAVAANTLNLCEFEQCASVDTKKCWCFHCLYATTLRFKMFYTWCVDVSGVGRSKILGAAKMLDFRRIPLFCWEKRFSKHKITILYKFAGGPWASGPPWLRLWSTSTVAMILTAARCEILLSSCVTHRWVFLITAPFVRVLPERMWKTTSLLFKLSFSKINSTITRW